MLDKITDIKIKENKAEFLTLLRTVKRDGIEKLIDYLEHKSDFFEAPASTRYHGSFKGGLCDHSLTVYKLLVEQAKMYEKFTGIHIDEESMKIVALLHDVSKVNTYEETAINKKVYSPDGSKHDELGNFDWVSSKAYKTIDSDDRFIFVNHEMGSEFIVRQFIPLRIAESVAIASHHGGMGHDSIPTDAVTPNYIKYPIALLLHSADLIAAFSIS